MLDIAVFLLIAFILPYLLFKPDIPAPTVGANASRFIETILIDMQSWIRTLPLWDFAVRYKASLNAMRRDDFNSWKMYGVTGTKRRQDKASRGYDKLSDILLATKIHLSGKVLSLCCGRGGWEQVIAPLPQVELIEAYTLGPRTTHRGHEAFTQKPFPGREKVKLFYADCTTLPTIPADVVLFDGGESHPNPELEAERFLRLLKNCVDHQLINSSQDFVLKILNPCHPAIGEYLQELQTRLGKGSLYRSAHSRNSTLEMYFVSTRATSLVKDIRSQLHHVFMKAATKRIIQGRDYMSEVFQRPLIKASDILAPLDLSKTIEQLGQPLLEPGRNFAQWESKGVYACGFTGSSANNIPRIAHELTVGLTDNLAGMQEWISTDTTPEGFTKTFLAKIDIAPEENTQYDQHFKNIYAGLARHYKNNGISIRELTWTEVEEALNKQGAAHFLDYGLSNISEFLALPNWIEIVESVRKDLESEKPTYAVFATMGKREKKHSPHGPKGSRMIAYYPIALRVLETKLFGQLDELTKPINNRFLVGGVGLHDLGELLRSRYIEVAESTDIAGFDTRIGVSRLTDEANFIQSMGLGETARLMYRLYAHPLILVPMPAPGAYHRTELLQGRGQRMSGSRVTYPMNSITRLAIELLRWCEVFEIPLDDIPEFIEEVMKPKGKYSMISGMGSGDDFTSLFTASLGKKFSATRHIFMDTGFPRKDIPLNIDTPITTTIPEVNFCSHNYEPVTFFQASTQKTVVRYMPTRQVSEIVGKARTWLGGSLEGGSAEAWISTQGVNLLVHYAHLRTVRALGLAYKSVVNPTLMLTATGFEYHRKPWMRPGDILDVINTLHFGDSTLFPVPGFKVEHFNHLGYLPPQREILYDPDSFKTARSNWRSSLHTITQRCIQRYNTGGSLDALNLWRKSNMIPV